MLCMHLKRRRTVYCAERVDTDKSIQIGHPHRVFIGKRNVLNTHNADQQMKYNQVQYSKYKAQSICIQISQRRPCYVRCAGTCSEEYLCLGHHVGGHAALSFAQFYASSPLGPISSLDPPPLTSPSLPSVLPFPHLTHLRSLSIHLFPFSPMSLSSSKSSLEECNKLPAGAGPRKTTPPNEFQFQCKKLSESPISGLLMADRYCTLQVINALGNGITLGISVFRGQLGRRYGPLPHKFAYAEAGGTTTITEISPNCTQGATVTSRAH